MFGWVIIGMTHLAFRQKEKTSLKLHYYGFPFTTLSTITILLLSLAGAFFTSQQLIGLLASLFLLLLYLGIYSFVKIPKNIKNA